MLVGRGVEHNLGTPRAEGVVKAADQPDVTDDGDEVKARELLLKLQTKVVHRGLGVVEKDELPNAEPSELAAELGADRTGGAGYHHDLVAEVLLNTLNRYLDLLAPEKVLDLHLADALEVELAVNGLADRRSDKYPYLGINAVSHQTVLLVPSVTGVGEEDRVYAVRGAEVLHVSLVLEVVDRLVRQLLVLELPAVADEAHNNVCLGVLELSHQRHALAAGAADQYPPGLLALTAAVALDQSIDYGHADAHQDQSGKGYKHVEADCADYTEGDRHRRYQKKHHVDRDALEEGGDDDARLLTKG